MLLTWFRLSFVEMWWSSADGAQHKTAQFVIVCIRLCFQNQNKTPLDHTIPMNTQTHFISFCLYFICSVFLQSVVRKTLTHVRSYDCIDFEGDVISLYAMCGSVLCTLAHNSNVGDDATNAICVSILRVPTFHLSLLI